MKSKGAVSLSMVLVIIAAVIAILVMLGAEFFGIDHLRALAVAVLVLAIAIVVPG